MAGGNTMIRRCTDTDIAAIDAIINEAAQAHWA
jgi:hypothetical protein